MGTWGAQARPVVLSLSLFSLSPAAAVGGTLRSPRPSMFPSAAAAPYAYEYSLRLRLWTPTVLALPSAARNRCIFVALQRQAIPLSVLGSAGAVWPPPPDTTPAPEDPLDRRRAASQTPHLSLAVPCRARRPTPSTLDPPPSRRICIVVPYSLFPIRHRTLTYYHQPILYYYYYYYYYYHLSYHTHTRTHTHTPPQQTQV